MADSYSFEFPGTKKAFCKQFTEFSHHAYSDGSFYYFDNYIVEFDDDEIRFGVERAGHSGGQWYIPAITERGGKTYFTGTIQYIGPKAAPADPDSPPLRKYLDKLGQWLLFLAVLPLVLIVYVVVKAAAFFKWIIRKTLRRPTAQPKTTEEKLLDLMENHLHCTRI